MRILFIYPNLNAQIGFNYGVAFLSAVLKSQGHTTTLININEKLGYPLDVERIKQDILAFNPDLIGFSMVSNQYRHCEKIAAGVKREFPGIPVVGGGIHATADPEGVMASGLFDFICLGEGEQALAELVTHLERNEDCTTIPNIWSRTRDGIVRNKVAPFTDLSTLPPKDYAVFDFQKMIDAKNGWVGIMTSRGCPYRCTYCFNHQMVTLYKKDLAERKEPLRYVRRHPVNEVIDELKYLLSAYENISTFIFDDDIFTLNKAYLIEFCKRYEQEIKVPFVVNAHVKNFDHEKAFALKHAGCTIVKFGLESGSECVRREILRRHMSNDDIIHSFSAAHDAGLHTSAFVMFGFPYETEDDIRMTIALLAQIKPGRFRWSIFFPYVNTDAYEIATRGGFINEEKQRNLENFFEESCLDFEPALGLWIDKLQKTFPWYVNSAADWPAASAYANLVREIHGLSAQEWAERKNRVLEEDKAVSEEMIQHGYLHYAVKYNTFMGVRSDYFLAEEEDRLA